MANFLMVLNWQQLEGDGEAIKRQLDEMGAHTVRHEGNADRALTYLQHHAVDYIIVGSLLAANAGSPACDTGGLAFCEAARQWTQTPMMLLVPALTSDIARACMRVKDLVPFDHAASAAAAALNVLSPTGGVEPALQIRITARPRNWSFVMKGVGFNFGGDGELNISSSASRLWFTDLMEKDWFDELSRIGDSIRIALCEDNPTFKQQRDLAHARASLQLGSAGQNLPEHLVFDVAADCYPLMLESVFDPTNVSQFWLARATSVARRLQGADADSAADLFSIPTAARRALVICADTHGMVYSDKLLNGKVQLDPLRLARIECNRVLRLLTAVSPRTRQPMFLPGNVKVLGLADPRTPGGFDFQSTEPVTRSLLESALRSGSWDLIHFAGHTYYQPLGSRQSGGTGFLFVGPPDEPTCIDFGDVVSYMRSARFVYLSSCESGNSGFAALAAEAGIHAVLGYRCRVNDRTAALQARLFYQMLLRSQSLGTAFSQARRRIYRRFGKQDNAWASAMLVTPEYRV